MRTELLALLFVLGACNRALGIDDVVRDTDGDGKLDDVDNCPDNFNPNQFDICPCENTGVDADEDGTDDGCDECVGPGPVFADTGGDGIDDGCEACAAATGTDADLDGIDDACDVCSLGPAHDEDGDGVEDACDVCPSLADPQQAIDVDADFIGDMCDPVTSAEVVRIFDPFVALVPHWAAAPAGWTIGNDVLEVAVMARSQMLTIVNVPAGVVIETLWTGNGDAGVVVVGSGRISCTIDDAGTLRLENSGDVTSRQVVGSGPRRLRLHTQPAPLGFAYVCSVIADTGVATGIQLDDQPAIDGRAGLFSTGTGTFGYFWQLTTLQ